MHNMHKSININVVAGEAKHYKQQLRIEAMKLKNTEIAIISLIDAKYDIDDIDAK